MTHPTVKPLLPPLDVPTGWSITDDIAPMAETTELAPSYDWLIVGAGITGISSARRLAELAPGASALLVEARAVGWGASGRNSGFLIDLPHKFELDSQDPAFLRKIIRLNRVAIADLKDAVRQSGAECDWSEVGKLQAAVKERGIGLMRRFCDVLDLVDEEYEVLDRSACQDILGTDYYSAAIFTAGSVLVDPFRMVRGLAAALPKNIALRDNAAVVEFTPLETGFNATLRLSGSIRRKIFARRVILANDPYVPQFGYMRNRILPSMTFASITRRLTDAERLQYRGRMNWGLTPADSGGTTLRMTSDGRILIRNHYGHAPNYCSNGRQLAKVRKAHRKGIDARFPSFADVPIANTWAGVVSLSRNHATFFGQMAPDVFSANCYNGVGMVRGAIAGKLLVDLALGLRSQDLDDLQSVSGLPSPFPPDPILSLGVGARMKLAEWESRKEI